MEAAGFLVPYPVAKKYLIMHAALFHLQQLKRSILYRIYATKPLSSD